MVTTFVQIGLCKGSALVILPTWKSIAGKVAYGAVRMISDMISDFPETMYAYTMLRYLLIKIAQNT